jgi:hypothetical protein
MKQILWFLCLFLFLTPALWAAEPTPMPNRLTNGDFEAGVTAAVPNGWQPFWSRQANTGTMALDTEIKHRGQASLKVSHTGPGDWSTAQTANLPVKPGEIYRLGGWVKCDNTESAELSVVTRDEKGNVLDWSEAPLRTNGTQDWQRLSRRFAVPPGCATVQYRLIGAGSGTVWLDEAFLVKEGEVTKAFQGKTLFLANRFLEVRLKADDGTLRVTDKRGGRQWAQQPFGAGMVVQEAKRQGLDSIHLTLWDVGNDLTLGATLTLAADAPELTVTLSGRGPVQQPVAFPAAFVSGKGTALVVPLNEGILYPVDDMGVDPMSLITYSGHGLCMPWFGLIDSQTGQGMMAISGTPDDGRVEITRRLGGDLFAQPEWDATRGQFGYPRKLTYVFFANGGYVALAKHYRAYAQQIGLFKTLAQKRRENPNVDKLIGAVDVWNWDMDKLTLCREMKALGMDHVLWSADGSASEIAAINALGYLSSRYDIYQDVYPPDAPKWLNTAGWPQDLVWQANGDWMKGWADKQKKADGTEVVYQGGVINSQRGLARAKSVIPADLRAKPYECRFIDTTTASPFREDYNPAHPLTRSEDRHYKMALLDFCSQTEKLVVGTETGIDPSVPYVHYYEGMMSLGPYRLPDAGYDMIGYRTPTPDFLKFQVGHFYRIPLWELVYHDCVVAHWYWGDATNKAPEVWPQRDLFNILYSTPPLFLFDKTGWAKNKAHFARTYQAVCPLVRRLGYDDMLSHMFLTPDHAVQRTRWSSGWETVVNFGTTPYVLRKGVTVPGLGWWTKTGSGTTVSLSLKGQAIRMGRPFGASEPQATAHSATILSAAGASHPNSPGL